MLKVPKISLHIFAISPKKHFLPADKQAYITQNNKFAISLQHLSKEVRDAVDLLHPVKN